VGLWQWVSGVGLWQWVFGMGPSWLFVWFVAVGFGSAGVGHGSADVGLWPWVLGLRRGSVAVVSDVGLSSLLICLGFLVVNMFVFIR
jgi:hypothetical protein